MAIMGHLFKIREHQMEYDSMFEPLAEILELLKIYDVEMPKDVYILMQVWSLLLYNNKYSRKKNVFFFIGNLLIYISIGIT